MQDEGAEQIRRERDLFLKLLGLNAVPNLSSLVDEALSLVVGACGALYGYIEVRRPDGDRVAWTAHGLSPEEAALAETSVSRGIVARAISAGKPVVTASARVDPMFRDLESVRGAGIEQVLCVPIVAEVPIGAVYLAGKKHGAEFEARDVRMAELVAASIAPLAMRLSSDRGAARRDDPTRPHRERLQADAIVGRSSAIASVLKDAALVAPLDVSVLLLGDSGTGKSLIARVIHDSGPRAKRRFLELNCAAIPAELFENELFGHARGAHSTAASDTPGKLAEAEGGTLFLDEVGEIPISSQAKLLQFLHSKAYFPLGSAKSRIADVRLIAATNADLDALVREGRFREDLLFRLSVLPIRLPALAERREDIAELAQEIVTDRCRHHRLRSVSLSPAARLALEHADWPGNVRQLANALEAAAIRASGDGAAQIEVVHVFPERRAAAATPLTYQEETREFQRRLLMRTLAETGWNVAEASRRLDLARSHLYNLIAVFGLARDAE